MEISESRDKPGRPDWLRWAALCARFALGAAFLSGIADRFGLYRGRNVGYGDFAGFVRYTAEVNSFMPVSTIPFLAWAATVAELFFGIAAKDIRVPVFVVRGDLDFWSRAGDSSSLAGELVNSPKVETLTIKGGTHYLFLDRPEHGQRKSTPVILSLDGNATWSGMTLSNIGNEALGMSRMMTQSMMVADALAIALSGYAQKSEPIPSDMMGTPGTVVPFVRDTACLLRNKNATVAKDAES